jgi:hypothetical protein
MAILLDNKEITDFVNTTESVNVLSYKSIEEVHDSIFMITTHNNQTFLKEKKGDWKTKPIVEFNIHTGNTLYKNVKFVLEKSGKSSLNFSKFGLDLKNKTTDRKILKEEKTPTQLVTNKPSPVVQPPDVTEDKMKQYVESAILQMLTNDKSEHFTKFFDLYTEGFKRDMIKYTEKISRRETYRVMESGGGTNAAQYANGGTMNGDLTVTGHINGHIGLSALDQGGATDQQFLAWNNTLQQWSPATGSGAGSVNKQIFFIGDGVSSSFIINHQFNSFDNIVQVYEEATKEVVYATIQNTDLNNTLVEFSFVPSASSYRVVIIN